MTVDKLASYNAKRDFARTAEPPGKRRAVRTKALAFVVQKHDATRLHWDLRLELGGVLLSWAVTRGPSADTKVRRLAVRTEDHPRDYGGFEGTIPENQYGGGTVMLWDRGTWKPLDDDPGAGIAAGKLHFILQGERMKGEWVLIRMKPDAGKKTPRENWLLFKIADEHAGGDDLVATYTTSVATGRTMAQIAAATDLDAGKPPGFRAPQLATLVERPPSGDDWLHETKYDGYRALIAIGGGKATVYTRSGQDWTDKFAAVARSAAALSARSALIDAEICALDADGRPSFGALQAALKDGREAFVVFAFDLLEHDGADLTRAPLTTRKAALAALLAAAPLAALPAAAPPPFVYAEHVRGGGERMFAALCDAGYEGVVSKRADASYRSGRGKTWLKAKCTRRQEFVIGGWRASGKGRGFASLLLGVRENGGLRYAGRVGTGFDESTIAALGKRLAGLAVDAPPFAGKLSAEARRDAHWVRPDLVAEIAFAEFTNDGNVRHASFIGLRDDKPVAKPRPSATGAQALAKLGVTITSPDRIVFPELGLSKAALAEYYAVLADAILVEAGGRLLSLVRCPQGRGKACFFQKHDSGMFPDSVRHVPVAGTGGKAEDYLYIDDAAGLLACVQMGTIEFHGWGSRVADVERPDRLVFDLDPDEALGFAAVKAAALLVRDRLAAAGMTSSPMLTGGKGVHVITALAPGAEWPAVKAWARRFATAMATDHPADFTATMSKAKRKGRIFIDWLRNQRGATAVMPWSVRARPGAGVAVPVTWQALATSSAANTHSAADAGAIAVLARRWRPLPHDQQLPAADRAAS